MLTVGSSTVSGRQRFRRLRVAQRVGDVQRVDAGHADDIAGLRALRLDALEAQVAHHLQHAAGARGAVAVDHRHLRIRRSRRA
jgi:hypothetical protein